MSEIIKALKAGMDIEKKGDTFYSKAVGEVENPRGQLTLIPRQRRKSALQVPRGYTGID